MSLARQEKLTPDEQTVLDLITNQEALISVVFDTDFSTPEKKIDYTYIDENYLNQMANPALYRPSRSATLFANKNYTITLMSTSPQPALETIEIRSTDAGLTYRLIGLDNKIKIDIIPWSEWPENSPREDDKIASSLSYEMYWNIIQHTSKAGYTLANGMPRPPVLKKINLRTFKIHDHKPGINRETKHKGVEPQFTAKTGTTLLPSDPRYIELWSSNEGKVAFLWDIKTCNLKKEKYVFIQDASTDASYWLDVDTDEKIAALKERMKEVPLATIASLRETNEKAVREKRSIFWNEILVGLPKGLMHAVFATHDTRSARLRALRAMQHVKEKLQLAKDLPVFIIQSFYAQEDNENQAPQRPGVFRVYSAAERTEDLAAEALEKQNAQAALQIIQNHRGLASLAADENELNNYVDQIADTTTNRPSHSVALFKKQGIPRPSWQKQQLPLIRTPFFKSKPVAAIQLATDEDDYVMVNAKDIEPETAQNKCLVM